MTLNDKLLMKLIQKRMCT